MKIDTKIATIPSKPEDKDKIKSNSKETLQGAANSDPRVDEIVLSNKYPNLTDEQINYLKGKYDIEHIGNDQLGQLLDDLANMGALDGKQKLFAYEAIKVPYSGFGLQFSTDSRPPSEMEDSNTDEGNLLIRMDKKLEQTNANPFSTPESKDLISYFLSILNLIKR